MRFLTYLSEGFIQHSKPYDPGNYINWRIFTRDAQCFQSCIFDPSVRIERSSPRVTPPKGVSIPAGGTLPLDQESTWCGSLPATIPSPNHCESAVAGGLPFLFVRCRFY